MATKSSDLRQPSKPALTARRKGKDDATGITKPTDVVLMAPIEGTGPKPEIVLAKGRFAATVLIPLCVFVAVLTFFACGVTINDNVQDLLGTSHKADSWVAFFQGVNSLVTTVIDKVFEGYVTVFIVVATMYLRNLQWVHDPKTGASRTKQLVLWLLGPAVMYNVHVAVTSMFVSHTAISVGHNFFPDDLLAPIGALESTVLNATTAANFTSTGNNVSVLDTILRGAVLQKVNPFKMDPNSICTLGNDTNADGSPFELPTVKEVRSTAVVYGFPTRFWNVDALPFGLVPDHTHTFAGNVSIDSIAQFEAFQQKANVSWLTMYELFLQGMLLFERSVSDANASAVYPCVWVDDKYELDLKANDSTITPNDPRNIFWEGDNKGKRRCFGAVSSLGALGNITDPAKHNVDSFLSSVTSAFLKTAEQVEPESMTFTTEVYEINPHLKLTSMTLDLPYYKAREYRNTSTYCNGSSPLPGVLHDITYNMTTASDVEDLQNLLCNQTNYPYVEPHATCGHSSCIFLDQSGTISFKKQLQLMPYLTNCTTEQLMYDDDFHNFFPSHCDKVKDTTFLYGLGSYMAGDKFDSDSKIGVPLISNPRRHIVVTFAKLEWTFQSINNTFDADCGVELSTKCSGLLYTLQNVTVPAVKEDPSMSVYKRVLVLGEGLVPTDLKQADYRTPVQLLSLHSRRFFYPKSKKSYEWEYLDLKHFKSTNWPETVTKRGGQPGNRCSPLVDSYITMLDTNNYYMDDPRQPLYTSAIFYLFQNAAIKTVKYDNAIVSSTSVGTTTLAGDLVEHTIMLKVPLMSIIMTFTGLVLLRGLAMMAMVTSKQRLRMTEEADDNVAHKYARFREEDEYPAEVFDRGLKLRATKHRLPIDECVVHSVTLHSEADASKKIVL